MAYLCADKRGEFIADEYPSRAWDEWRGWRDVYGETCTLISLPKGTIKKLIGKELTWEDEPYEMPLNMFTNEEL
jgi:hypothetical protein